MKTALDILEMHFGSDFWHFGPNEKKHIENAMREYAEQAIEQCAKEAVMVFHDGRTKENKSSTQYMIGCDNLKVDKESILNVKTLLN